MSCIDITNSYYQHLLPSPLAYQIVILSRGLSKSNKHTAFRVWFSELHEFRSLLPGVPFIALTATATKDTRTSIFDALMMNEPCLIMQSPHKENISYVVKYMEKGASLSSYFSWLADEMITQKLHQLELLYIARQSSSVLLFTGL